METIEGRFWNVGDEESPSGLQEKQAEWCAVSDKVDKNNRRFVLNSEGRLVFGEITADTGLSPAPILLSEGKITNHATKDGYGLVHIEARHGNQIRQAGYNSVVEFVETVAKNYEVIRKGNVRNGVQTFMLQITHRHNKTLMIELSGNGSYWNINTAGIFKISYGAKREEVYNRHTTVRQTAEPVGESQNEEPCSTTSPSSMNSPISSEGKVTDSFKDSNSPGKISGPSA